MERQEFAEAIAGRVSMMTRLHQAARLLLEIREHEAFGATAMLFEPPEAEVGFTEQVGAVFAAYQVLVGAAERIHRELQQIIAGTGEHECME